MMESIIAILAFIAANYINIVTFFVIHRMKKETPWGVASGIIAIAAIGSFVWLKTLSYLLGLIDHIPTVPSIVTIIVAIILAIAPRVDVNSHQSAKVH